MTVEGKEKTARGVGVTPFDPLGRPPMAGKQHPCFGALQACLNVCHIPVRSLPTMTGQKGIDVSRFSCLHGGRGAGAFREDGSAVLLISDLVAHEDNPALEPSRKVAEGSSVPFS